MVLLGLLMALKFFSKDVKGMLSKYQEQVISEPNNDNELIQPDNERIQPEPNYATIRNSCNQNQIIAMS